ncbi:LacI family transcriptional regulator [Haematobacter missouriensis]|uniref:LacI family transcriptional regulator n=1 Tax=Haematobacter missouriensis TaxID=366616 RepID=A0A212AHQ7_9RHOB|nr:LacI family DNA-binding transcriptional regulator [Haematobacter missouriensis]KFI25412.1 LacI family transcriptional regulator [Haematobacter missouriensis]OWJ72021.1 LacI family transcriptional regulator [Haematobacter missouriensis]OWJ81060.1 LacI family transcriptional regulator [Haematobacter missouriensis]
MTSTRIRPNLSQIAARLNVSVATVSNALSGKGRVSPEVAERIRTTAAEMGYVPARAARALRTGRSHVIGLVLPDISNPLFPQIARAIEQAAANVGYAVLIADARDDVTMQTEAIARLLERGVDGIVVVPRRGSRIADIGSPVAVIDSPSTPGNTVSADHWQGGRLIMSHLLSLGHRKVLILGNDPTSNVQNDRVGGMRSCHPNMVEVMWAERIERRSGPGQPLRLADKFAQGFTAFATVSDLLAIRALTELLGAGIAVPDQASVSGFDDLLWSSVVRPALTTVRMDLPLIAERAIAALTDAIEYNLATPGSPLSFGSVKLASPALERVPMTLVVRETAATPRNAATADRKTAQPGGRH